MRRAQEKQATSVGKGSEAHGLFAGNKITSANFIDGGFPRRLPCGVIEQSPLLEIPRNPIHLVFTQFLCSFCNSNQ